MTTFLIRACAGAVLLLAGMINGSWAAEPTKAQPGRITPASRPPSPASKSGSTARGPLPDPVLLDGSTQPAEKKSEYGMIGDFELPGDENAKDGKVGGAQNPGGQQNQQGGGSGMPMALPQGGGAGQAQQQAGESGPAGQQGGAQPPPAQQNPSGGAGDPNAKAEGTQVAQLGGESSGEQPPPSAEKPPAVAIGDSAMQIKAAANSPGVVGGQQIPAKNTQQHEKGTGTGGKGPTGGPGNNRVEKGRTIPAGL